MNIKNGLVCLSIIASLALCTMNVAVASPAKYSTDVQNGRVTNMRGELPTYLFISLTDPKNGSVVGVENCTVKVGATVFLDGRLIGGMSLPSAVAHPLYITNATIHIQSSRDGKTWTTDFDTKTGSDTGSDVPGMILITIAQNFAGVCYYRAIYDGTNGPDSYTTPAVSNAVKLTTY